MRRSQAVILPLLLIVFSCNRNPLNVDVSDTEIEPLKVQRLDKDLFEVNGTNLSDKTRELKSKYGDFYEHYLMGFIARKGTEDPMYGPLLIQFTQDKDVRECHSYV